MNQRKLGVIISYITMALNIFLGIFYTPFMLEKLGASEYGVYSLAGSLTAFVTMLDLGFNQTLVRYLAKYRALGDEKKERLILGFFLKLYCAIAVIAMILGAILLYFYPMLCKSTMTVQELSTFRMVFIIMLINIVLSFPMCIFSAVLNTHEKFVYMKFVVLVCVVIKYGAITVALLWGYKSIALALVGAIVSVITQLSYMFYCVKKIHIKFEFGKVEKELIQEILSFSFFIFLNIVIDYLYNNTDKLILGSVSGTVAVSIYAVGIQFTTYFQEMSTTICGVFLPRISYLYEHENNMKEISNLFNKVGRIQMVMLFLVLSAFTSFGRGFVRLWVGDLYDDAYIIALVIMIPALVPLTQNLGITILRVMNMHKYRSYMYIVIAIINVIATIPLAMKFQGIGAAIATCGANILGQILFMNFFYAKIIKLDIKEYWMNFIKLFIYSMPFVFMFYRCEISSWGTFIVWAVVYSIAYLIGYYILMANDYEKNLVKSFVGRIIKR